MARAGANRLLVALASLCLLAIAVQAALPAGFIKEKLMDIEQAMSMVFLPDGRLLVGERPPHHTDAAAVHSALLSS